MTQKQYRHLPPIIAISGSDFLNDRGGGDQTALKPGRCLRHGALTVSTTSPKKACREDEPPDRPHCLSNLAEETRVFRRHVPKIQHIIQMVEVRLRLRSRSGTAHTVDSQYGSHPSRPTCGKRSSMIARVVGGVTQVLAASVSGTWRIHYRQLRSDARSYRHFVVVGVRRSRIDLPRHLSARI